MSLDDLAAEVRRLRAAIRTRRDSVGPAPSPYVADFDGTGYELAHEPNDLARLFIERANAGDLEGLIVLFEPDALVSSPDGDASGHAEIRRKYLSVLARKPRFSLGEQQPAMINGEIALTCTYFADGGAAAEVARQQPDGSWLWMIDKGSISG